MATTSKALGRGAFATSSATLYTVPSATTAVVTNIVITNTASSAGTFTLALNGVSLATTVAVAANSIITLDIKQVISATQTITGLASATTINYHISGVEIS
jgi:phage-related protein